MWWFRRSVSSYSLFKFILIKIPAFIISCVLCDCQLYKSFLFHIINKIISIHDRFMRVWHLIKLCRNIYNNTYVVGSVIVTRSFFFYSSSDDFETNPICIINTRVLFRCIYSSIMIQFFFSWMLKNCFYILGWLRQCHVHIFFLHRTE
jgi:hypothetical protein